jgi:outer membrane protein TolC
MRLRPAVVVATLVLGGCATFSQDGGFDEVQQLASDRLGTTVQLARADKDLATISARVTELLAKPLGVEDAVQLALLNNPGLQASYAELGIAEADLVQAGRIPNPRFSTLRTKRGNDVSKVEESLSLEILGLLIMPLRSRMERQRFEQTKLEVARQVVELAADTRRAWIQAVAADETARYTEQVKASAEATAELARRMARAGNFPKITQMREQVFYAEAVAQLARARQAAIAERERLVRSMGVFGEQTKFQLPARLPELPASPRDVQDVEAAAVAQRLDIQAARRDNEAVAQSLGLTKVTRFISALELGRARTKEGDEPFSYGWEVTVEIPLFDWGSARVAKAEATYMQSAQRLAEVAVNARSEVRTAHSAYLTAYETAKHYRDEILPLRRKISEESLLRYNGMLISVFELLADAREQISAVNGAIETLRDYWLADIDLQAALTAGSGRPSASRTPTIIPTAARGGRH